MFGIISDAIQSWMNSEKAQQREFHAISTVQRLKGILIYFSLQSLSGPFSAILVDLPFSACGIFFAFSRILFCVCERIHSPITPESACVHVAVGTRDPLNFNHSHIHTRSKCAANRVHR